MLSRWGLANQANQERILPANRWMDNPVGGGSSPRYYSATTNTDYSRHRRLHQSEEKTELENNLAYAEELLKSWKMNLLERSQLPEMHNLVSETARRTHSKSCLIISVAWMQSAEWIMHIWHQDLQAKSAAGHRLSSTDIAYARHFRRWYQSDSLTSLDFPDELEAFEECFYQVRKQKYYDDQLAVGHQLITEQQQFHDYDRDDDYYSEEDWMSSERSIENLELPYLKYGTDSEGESELDNMNNNNHNNNNHHIDYHQSYYGHRRHYIDDDYDDPVIAVYDRSYDEPNIPADRRYILIRSGSLFPYETRFQLTWNAGNVIDWQYDSQFGD